MVAARQEASPEGCRCRVQAEASGTTTSGENFQDSFHKDLPRGLAFKGSANCHCWHSGDQAATQGPLGDQHQSIADVKPQDVSRGSRGSVEPAGGPGGLGVGVGGGLGPR